MFKKNMLHKITLSAVALVGAATLQANEGVHLSLNLGGSMLSGKHSARMDFEGEPSRIVAENKSLSTKGFLGEGRAAYLFDAGSILVGPELFFGHSPNEFGEDRKKGKKISEISKVKSGMFGGAGALIGFKARNGLMPYVRFAFEAMSVTQTWKTPALQPTDTPIEKKKKHILPGGRVGLGVQKMWGNWGMNVGYDFSMHKSAKASHEVKDGFDNKATITQELKSPKVHKVSLGLVYRF